MGFRRHFFRHPDFLRFNILKKKIFKNLDFGYHRKMYRLVPCIPILRGFFFMKNAKKMCICEYVIFGVDTFGNLCFDLKKGYKQIKYPR